jgi:iron uptake system component EfeO
VIRIRAGVAVAVLAAGVAGCGTSSSSGKGGHQVNVSISDKGCDQTSLKLAAGPVSFRVTNHGSAKVTEFEVLDGSRILGEVENVSPGISGSFSLTLQPGTYTINCTNGSTTPHAKLVVTGAAVATQAGARQRRVVADYRRYLERQTGMLVRTTRAFAAGVTSGSVATAKARYAAARAPYERIEPVAESFGDLDPRIDARANDVPASKWSGFHPIEKSLWARGTTSGQAPFAKGLVTNVTQLRTLVKSVRLEPAQIANGAVSLLGEISKSKITGEEERYSHIDLVDFDANVQGARAAFDAVAQLLPGSASALVTRRFAAVDKSLAPYRRGAGFVSYTDLTGADKRKLSQAIDALAEPLSKVPSQIV